MTKRTVGVDPEALENREQAAASASTTKRPRRDKGTRRIVLPAWLVKDLEALAERRYLGGGVVSLLIGWVNGAGENVTLPPAALARLAPAAAGSGRSISELLAEMEGDLVKLLDGRLYETTLVRDDEAGPNSPETFYGWPISSLEDRLVESFRARIRAAQEPAP